MTQKELIQLQNFLTHSDIPIVPKKNKTFLGISRQPHYENIWSNIYAFFFDVNEEHNLNDLFIKSIVEIIQEKTQDTFYFNPQFEIITEFSTEEDGRIDILLRSENEAIIIENKVFHLLDNNLVDYWKSVKTNSKQGIILSLKKFDDSVIESILEKYKTDDYDEQNKKPNFISITHIELLSKVISNLPTYFFNANEKFIIYLKDFYQNVMNITEPIDPKIIDFYYKNQNEINRIKQIRDDYSKYITSEIEKAINQIPEELELQKNRNEHYRFYTNPDDKNLMITIVFSELFTDKKELFFIIELQNDLVLKKEAINKINFSDEELRFIKKDFYEKTDAWAHFAFQVERPNENEILELRSFIAKTIVESPILSIYKKLKKALVSESKTALGR